MKKVLKIILTISACIFLINCSRSDSNTENQKVGQQTAVTGTDSVSADTSLENLDRAAEELKKEALEVQKEIDKLLED